MTKIQATEENTERRSFSRRSKLNAREPLKERRWPPLKSGRGSHSWKISWKISAKNLLHQKFQDGRRRNLQRIELTMWQIRLCPSFFVLMWQ
jgi:hypothetical protein